VLIGSPVWSSGGRSGGERQTATGENEGCEPAACSRETRQSDGRTHQQESMGKLAGG